MGTLVSSAIQFDGNVMPFARMLTDLAALVAPLGFLV
jgi:hypothetical protein